MSRVLSLITDFRKGAVVLWVTSAGPLMTGPAGFFVFLELNMSAGPPGRAELGGDGYEYTPPALPVKLGAISSGQRRIRASATSRSSVYTAALPSFVTDTLFP